MNISDIIKLIDKLNATSINELNITEDKFQLHLSKNKTNTFIHESTAPIATAVIDNTTADVICNEFVENSINDSDVIIKSPLVGIYYESSSPDIPPFLSVGQKVKAGDVVCIIEAMKIFNEIKSPCSGIVKKIYTSNLEVIEYDQELIVIGEE